ncbi:hypothetical protein EZS27_021877 [termite gut metagenome]|uniref:InsA N-terminal zinc ribbon domain-containing protein n=1 Tax=termite gut metagenome TaxID=433724 RepID=A0A5J4R6P6_9ZZZZ
MKLTIPLHCPNCQSPQIKKNGRKSSGKQNYLCKACFRQFIGDHALTSKGCHSGLIKRILLMLVRGIGIRDISAIQEVMIISELMFYVNIMDDLMTHYINYPEDAKKVKLRGFDKLYDAYINKKINKIKGHFLAEELHPLISDNVVELINNNKLSHIEYLTKKL